MPAAIQVILQFWQTVVIDIPNTPFIYLFALAIVLVIANNIYFWVRGG